MLERIKFFRDKRDKTKNEVEAKDRTNDASNRSRSASSRLFKATDNSIAEREKNEINDREKGAKTGSGSIGQKQTKVNGRATSGEQNGNSLTLGEKVDKTKAVLSSPRIGRSSASKDVDKKSKNSEKSNKEKENINGSARQVQDQISFGSCKPSQASLSNRVSSSTSISSAVSSNYGTASSRRSIGSSGFGSNSIRSTSSNSSIRSGSTSPVPPEKNGTAGKAFDGRVLAARSTKTEAESRNRSLPSRGKELSQAEASKIKVKSIFGNSEGGGGSELGALFRRGLAISSSVRIPRAATAKVEDGTRFSLNRIKSSIIQQSTINSNLRNKSNNLAKTQDANVKPNDSKPGSAEDNLIKTDNRTINGTCESDNKLEPTIKPPRALWKTDYDSQSLASNVTHTSNNSDKTLVSTTDSQGSANTFMSKISADSNKSESSIDSVIYVPALKKEKEESRKKCEEEKALSENLKAVRQQQFPLDHITSLRNKNNQSATRNQSTPLILADDTLLLKDQLDKCAASNGANFQNSAPNCQAQAPKITNGVKSIETRRPIKKEVESSKLNNFTKEMEQDAGSDNVVIEMVEPMLPIVRNSPYSYPRHLSVTSSPSNQLPTSKEGNRLNVNQSLTSGDKLYVNLMQYHRDIKNGSGNGLARAEDQESLDSSSTLIDGDSFEDVHSVTSSEIRDASSFSGLNAGSLSLPSETSSSNQTTAYCNNINEREGRAECDGPDLRTIRQHPFWTPTPRNSTDRKRLPTPTRNCGNEGRSSSRQRASREGSRERGGGVGLDWKKYLISDDTSNDNSSWSGSSRDHISLTSFTSSSSSTGGNGINGPFARKINLNDGRSSSRGGSASRSCVASAIDDEDAEKYNESLFTKGSPSLQQRGAMNKKMEEGSTKQRQAAEGSESKAAIKPPTSAVLPQTTVVVSTHQPEKLSLLRAPVVNRPPLSPNSASRTNLGPVAANSRSATNVNSCPSSPRVQTTPHHNNSSIPLAGNRSKSPAVSSGSSALNSRIPAVSSGSPLSSVKKTHCGIKVGEMIPSTSLQASNGISCLTDYQQNGKPLSPLLSSGKMAQSMNTNYAKFPEHVSLNTTPSSAEPDERKTATIYNHGSLQRGQLSGSTRFGVSKSSLSNGVLQQRGAISETESMECLMSFATSIQSQLQQAKASSVASRNILLRESQESLRGMSPGANDSLGRGDNTASSSYSQMSSPGGTKDRIPRRQVISTSLGLQDSKEEGYYRRSSSHSPYGTYSSASTKLDTLRDDELNDSSLSLVSNSSSVHSTIEEKQSHEIRRLKRELEATQEKVATLTVQLSTNAHVITAFEQSLSNMTARLQNLSMTAEQKESQLIELRSTLEYLQQSAQWRGSDSANVHHRSSSVSSSTASRLSSTQSDTETLQNVITGSMSSLSSLSSACSGASHQSSKIDSDVTKTKKKNWLRSSFAKAFTRRKSSKGGSLELMDSTKNISLHSDSASSSACSPSSAPYRLPSESNMLSSALYSSPVGATALHSPSSVVRLSNSILSSGSSMAANGDAILELQQKLHEKDMKLTDTRLEALNSAHQLEQLRETINRMSDEMASLRAFNERLQKAVCSKGLSSPMPGDNLQAPKRLLSLGDPSKLDMLTTDPHDYDGRRITVSVCSNSYNEGTWKTHQCKHEETLISVLSVSGRTKWPALDVIIRKKFTEKMLGFDPVSNLGLNGDSIHCYHIGDQIVRHNDSFNEAPELLPCGYLVGDNTNIGIRLKGSTENCVDMMAFETLVPKPILERYMSLLSEHRRIILCGPSGTGKTYLAQRLAEFLVVTSGRALAPGVIDTFNVDRKSNKELRQYLVNVAEQCEHATNNLANGEILPHVIILDNLHHITSLGEVFNGFLNAKYQTCPYIIGTMNQTTGITTNLQLHHNFRWVLYANHMEPVKGFLSRYLKKRLTADEVQSGKRNNHVTLIVEWIPRVWQHVNKFLETHCSSEATIGPSMFLPVPLDVGAAESWFADLWNYCIIPYLMEAVREGIQLHGKRGGWEDPTNWIIKTYPWSRQADEEGAEEWQPTLLHLKPNDFGYESRGEFEVAPEAVALL